MEGWEHPLRIVEIIIHPKFRDIIKATKRTVARKDYDIALMRLDYPVLDAENSGIR